MPALMARSISSSSTETASTTSTTTTSIPFVRRRMSADQVQALHNLYEAKSHPSKQERADLARELNLELKVVNVWFQNKRRSMKKKSIAWNRATVLMSENAFGMGKARFSTLAHPSKQKSLIRRDPTVSLDSIAAFREKKEALTYPRPPFTPRKNTVANLASSTERMDIGDDKSSLWDLLPSSPQLPPSSPTKETTLLSALPPQSRTMKSLEWACAKDRVGRRKKTQDMLRDLEEEDDDDDEHDVPDLMLDSTGGDDTDIDEDMITPDNSMSLSTIPGRHRTSSLESRKGKADEDTPNEDVEAAMALLKFKVRSS